MLPTILLTAEEAIKACHVKCATPRSAWAQPNPGRHQGYPADGVPRHPDGDHAGAGARNRRNGAIAVHLAFQRFLDEPNASILSAENVSATL